jgi:phosphoribosylformylglycinamidine synthase
MWTQGVDRVIRVPIAHGEGRFICEEETLKRLEGEGQVAFRYVDAGGSRTPESNPNGSMAAIAGVLNPAGNVLGMMPHPERATRALLGGEDGKLILQALSLVNAG